MNNKKQTKQPLFAVLQANPIFPIILIGKMRFRQIAELISVKWANRFTSNGRIKSRQMTEFKIFFVSLHPIKVL